MSQVTDSRAAQRCWIGCSDLGELVLLEFQASSGFLATLLVAPESIGLDSVQQTEASVAHQDRIQLALDFVDRQDQQSLLLDFFCRQKPSDSTIGQVTT